MARESSKPIVRQHRVDLAIRVELKYPDRDVFVERFAQNVSRTGLFVRAKDPPAVGSRVRFEYKLADGTRLLRGVGIVRWARTAAVAKEPDQPAGMGIEFVDLDADSEELIGRIVALHGEGERAPRRATAPARPAAAGGAPAGGAGRARAAARPLDREEETALDSLLEGLGLGEALPARKPAGPPGEREHGGAAGEGTAPSVTGPGTPTSGAAAPDSASSVPVESERAASSDGISLDLDDAAGFVEAASPGHAAAAAAPDDGTRAEPGSVAGESPGGASVRVDSGPAASPELAGADLDGAPPTSAESAGFELDAAPAAARDAARPELASSSEPGAAAGVSPEPAGSGPDAAPGVVPDDASPTLAATPDDAPHLVLDGAPGDVDAAPGASLDGTGLEVDSTPGASSASAALDVDAAPGATLDATGLDVDSTPSASRDSASLDADVAPGAFPESAALDTGGTPGGASPDSATLDAGGTAGASRSTTSFDPDAAPGTSHDAASVELEAAPGASRDRTSAGLHAAPAATAVPPAPPRLLSPVGEELREPEDPVTPTLSAGGAPMDDAELVADLSSSTWRAALVPRGGAFSNVGDAVEATAGAGEGARALPSPFDWLVVPWPAPRARVLARRIGLELVDDDSGFPAIRWRGLDVSGAALLQLGLEKLLGAVSPSAPPRQARIVLPAGASDAARRLLLRRLAGLGVARCVVTPAPAAVLARVPDGDATPALVIEVLRLEARLAVVGAEGELLASRGCLEAGYDAGDGAVAAALAGVGGIRPAGAELLDAVRTARRAAPGGPWLLAAGGEEHPVETETVAALARAGYEALALAADDLLRGNDLEPDGVRIVVAPEEPLWPGLAGTLAEVLGARVIQLEPDPWIRLRGLTPA